MPDSPEEVLAPRNDCRLNSTCNTMPNLFPVMLRIIPNYLPMDSANLNTHYATKAGSSDF